MKIKTNELVDVPLDWAVATCEGLKAAQLKANGPVHVFRTVGYEPTSYEPSRKWERGGPIIERERIQVFPHNGASEWCGVIHVPRDGYTGILTQDGPTPLIAAMRCFVFSRLGDEVDVPDELLGGTNPDTN